MTLFITFLHFYERCILCCKHSPGGKSIEEEEADEKRLEALKVRELVGRAETLLSRAFAMFEERKKSADGGDHRWLKQVLSSGTLTDKVAAMTLMVQESPLHRLDTLDSLMSMARKKGRREATMAMDALKDLFVSSLLPDRKLRYFNQQPYNMIPPPSDRQLLFWHLEDRIKTHYSEILRLLEEGTHDQMLFVKKARLTAVYDLLNSKPEGESALLSMLCNKLGDPEKKIASRVVYLLNELIRHHPGMKIAVAAEIERLLFRPHVSQRSQYYGIVFLNQIVFVPGYVSIYSISVAFPIPSHERTNGMVNITVMHYWHKS
jgi:ribosome biogenesis protein MAK21